MWKLKMMINKETTMMKIKLMNLTQMKIYLICPEKVYLRRMVQNNSLVVWITSKLLTRAINFISVK